MHPQYKGPRTLDREQKLYSLQPFENEADLKTLRQRSNAVCEILKFYSQARFDDKLCPPNSPPEAIYDKALALLRCGNIRDAVKHLNQHKMNRLALLVSRSISSLSNNSMSKSYVWNLVGQNSPVQLMKIVEHITGGQGQD